MAKIAVLDKHTAELIAAGEVVERPSSVIKELVENCMDAGATDIRVEIRNGGVTYMCVTDNGEGMEREDVPVAFLRHATSKVKTAPDLDAISTLGFRGEALASIAAVSRVDLITRREQDLAGTQYSIEGGEPGELCDIGCAKGTTIVVKDLFYNVPARMKFLKKDVSEGNAVAAVMDRLALSRPDISFTFVRDGKEELHTAGDGDFRGCIYSVLGREFSKQLLAVDYSLDGVRVSGFISAPTASRPNRTMQHFFVNRRYVKTRTAMAALEQAYKGAVMSGKFPACVLFLELPPETVDANVHPAKVEIRFIDERPVFSAVYHGVKSALEGSSVRKTVSLPTPNSTPPVSKSSQLVLDFQKPISSSVPTPAARESVPSRSVFSPDIQREDDTAFQPKTTFRMNDPGVSSEDMPKVVESLFRAVAQPPCETITVKQESSCSDETEKSAPLFVQEVRVVEEEAVRPPIRYIGELFATYILAEMDDALYVIDKHAAHERLLYNQLIATPHAESQPLLVPLSVSLSREEYEAVMDHEENMKTVGFEVEEFGDCEVLVRAVPLVLIGCDIVDAIREIAGGFAAGYTAVRSSALDWLYHSTACRAAVKAGNISSSAELAKFAERVLYSEDIRTCPHGRPVCFSLTKQEIEKQFGRIV